MGYIMFMPQAVELVVRGFQGYGGPQSLDTTTTSFLFGVGGAATTLGAEAAAIEINRRSTIAHVSVLAFSLKVFEPHLVFMQPMDIKD
jgi:hypothetical protein